MSPRTDTDFAKAEQLLDEFVELGFVSIQRSVSVSHDAGAGTMISNSPDRSPLLSAEIVERIAGAFDVAIDMRLLEFVNASVLRVRPNSTYVTSMAPDPKWQGHYVILLNNKWYK